MLSLAFALVVGGSVVDVGVNACLEEEEGDAVCGVSVDIVDHHQMDLLQQ